MIELQCKCGKKLKVPDEAAGKRGKCPTCGSLFAIPSPSAAAKAQNRAPAPQRAAQDDFFSDLPPVQTGPAPGTPAAIPGYDALMPQGFDHVPAPQENPYAAPAAPVAPAKNPHLATPAAGGKVGCYNCGSTSYSKIHWTIWGGIIGPMMFSHVRCNSCGTTFNSKTGKSNNTAITIYIAISLVVVFGLILVGAIAGNA